MKNSILLKTSLVDISKVKFFFTKDNKRSLTKFIIIYSKFLFINKKEL